MLCFNKQLQRPGICDCQQLRVGSFTIGSAPSPEVTVPFCLVPSAEFSQALGISTWPPVSVWGTICLWLSLRAFPGSMGSTTSLTKSTACYQISLIVSGFALKPTTSFHLDNHRQAGITFSVPPSHRKQKYWNINQFPIDYAFQPRLRGRLTQPRLTLDWNPWSSGVRAFHLFCRYSRQHSLLWYLQHAFTTHLHRLTQRSPTT